MGLYCEYVDRRSRPADVFDGTVLWIFWQKKQACRHVWWNCIVNILTEEAGLQTCLMGLYCKYFDRRSRPADVFDGTVLWIFWQKKQACRRVWWDCIVNILTEEAGLQTCLMGLYCEYFDRRSRPADVFDGTVLWIFWQKKQACRHVWWNCIVNILTEEAGLQTCLMGLYCEYFDRRSRPADVFDGTVLWIFWQKKQACRRVWWNCIVNILTEEAGLQTCLMELYCEYFDRRSRPADVFDWTVLWIFWQKKQACRHVWCGCIVNILAEEGGLQMCFIHFVECHGRGGCPEIDLSFLTKIWDVTVQP